MTAKNQEYIWYASYGSNILEQRFHCYIRGGQTIGSAKEYQGCADKTLPIDKEEVYINSELYFAKNSSSWDNGGVGFIKVNFDDQVQTLGRMYLITKDQFVDVVKQETANEGQLAIDFDRGIAEGSVIFRERSWYGNLIYLGNRNDYPIFTFTHACDILEEANKPSKAYLNTIIKGIQETYNLSTEEITDYLISKTGIEGNFTRQQLEVIIESKLG